MGKWLQETNRVQGFHFAGGDEGVTQGIDFWSEPLLVTEKGKKKYVLLVDSQGLFDNGKGRKVEKAIMAITALISDLMICNIFSRLNSQISECFTSLIKYRFCYCFHH